MKRTKKTTARLKKGEKVLGLGVATDRQNQEIPKSVINAALKRYKASSKSKSTTRKKRK